MSKYGTRHRSAEITPKGQAALDRWRSEGQAPPANLTNEQAKTWWDNYLMNKQVYKDYIKGKGK